MDSPLHQQETISCMKVKTVKFLNPWTVLAVSRGIVLRGRTTLNHKTDKSKAVCRISNINKLVARMALILKLKQMSQPAMMTELNFLNYK